jgi:hypothetical protein
MPAKRVSLKGKGADLFFGGNQSQAADEILSEQVPVETVPSDTETSGDIPPAPSAAPLPGDEPPRDEPVSLPVGETAPETAGAAEVTRKPSRYPASTLAHNAEAIEAIRRVVKQTGREVSFVRLSPEEKGRLADIVYTYRRQGRKTTENELNRIAINALLEDYDAHGAQSVLARVLDALHA